MTPILSEKLGQATVGFKEDSGQTRCEKGFVQQLDDPKRFITNYQIRFEFLNEKKKKLIKDNKM